MLVGINTLLMRNAAMTSKTYTLWVQKYNCTVKIVSDTKNHAISVIRYKMALTWQDDIKCLGINL
jgi:hypothetical protein